MKFRSMVALSAIVIAAGASHAAAQTQAVTLEVQTVNKLAFSSGTIALQINNGTAGGGLTAATGTGTYSITTNDTTQKITAQIDQATPTGVTLSVDLTAPSGGTSTAQQLGTTAVDVVTGISKVSSSGLNVVYTLSAVVSAGVVPQTSRTVTYTLVAGT
jgi:hypothetical protein